MTRDPHEVHVQSQECTLKSLITRISAACCEQPVAMVGVEVFLAVDAFIVVEGVMYPAAVPLD